MIGPANKFKLYLRSIGRQLQDTEKKMLDRFSIYSSACTYRNKTEMRCDHPKANQAGRKALGLNRLQCNMNNCHYVNNPGPRHGGIG